MLTKFVKNSICSFVRSNCMRHTRFFIAPVLVIISRTYMRRPVGITSTLVITENCETWFVEYVAHFVISASAAEALSTIASSGEELLS